MSDSSVIPTEVQWQYMKFIEAYIRNWDNFPTIVSAANHFGVSANAASGHYAGLKRRRLITKVPNAQCYCRTEQFKRLIAQGGVA